ncbi:MAG: signal peptide peptidase SppA [Planctomycetia bacterium]|nr:signal peptide peptidase SppA [Planctomycetia bacterium]
MSTILNNENNTNNGNHPPYIIVPKRSGRNFLSGCLFGCSGCLFPFFLLILLSMLSTIGALGSLMTGTITVSPTRQEISGPKDPFVKEAPKVAVITVDGAIMSTDDFINDQIEDVLNDETVKAVVLRMDTPGGSVSASDYYYNKLTKLREERKIPIVVSMGGVCASGGYYMAMACGTENEGVLFAEPTTWTGSIGVIISSYDFSGLAAKIGVKEDSIKSHELKGMGSILRPFTEKEREILQALVDDAFGRFQNVIYTGRKQFAENHDALIPLATGQVFTTKDALKSGLIDREGYLEDAIDRALELAGLDKKMAQVYRYSETATLSDLLTASEEKLGDHPENRIRQLAVPRAFYLWGI